MSSKSSKSSGKAKICPTSLRSHHPKGSQLPALERNILKYRALEMVMILFRIEDLKKFVKDSIQATDRFRDKDKQRIPVGTKEVYKKTWAVLVADGILTQAESDDLQRLVAYRNDIGHRIHLLTCDLSRAPIAQYFSQWKGVKYDYGALKKIEHYRHKIWRGFQSKYLMSISPNHALFEAAEKTYQQELRRLNQKIIRQIAIRKEEIQKLNAELLLEDSGLLSNVDPYHPLNKAANGTLTNRGIEICFKFFDHNKSTLAVAYLMHISYRAAVNRRRTWERAGGKFRQKSH